MANITCDQTVSDTLFIIEHEHIFQWHTRICFAHPARPMYSNILQCQNIQAYVYTVHTHVTHITGRLDYTCPDMKLESCACIQGRWVRGAVTMQAGATDRHKSRLQRIWHKKLRWWGINSQFGSAVVKLSLWAPLNPISMIPVQTGTYSISRELPSWMALGSSEGWWGGEGEGVHKQASVCFTSAGEKNRNLIGFVLMIIIPMIWTTTFSTQWHNVKEEKAHAYRYTVGLVLCTSRNWNLYEVVVPDFSTKVWLRTWLRMVKDSGSRFVTFQAARPVKYAQVWKRSFFSGMISNPKSFLKLCFDPLTNCFSCSKPVSQGTV